MERRRVKRELTERVKEIYESTRNVVRIHEEMSGWFWTEAGMRHGCPLSPILFTLLIADVEEEMKKGQVGGIRIGKERIWTLAYADDLVIMAKSEEGMKEMLKRMERYLKLKKLQLNIEKSKIICFEKRGRRRKIKWKWEGKEIEEVAEVKYFGVVLKKNGKEESQVKELRKKANVVINVI